MKSRDLKDWAKYIREDGHEPMADLLEAISEEDLEYDFMTSMAELIVMRGKYNIFQITYGDGRDGHFRYIEMNPRKWKVLTFKSSKTEIMEKEEVISFLKENN